MKDTININNTEIYYETYGKGIPILIIHGWRVDHHVMSGPMEKIFRGSNKKYQRIYIDLPGMGKSQVNQEVKTADDVLNILINFIELIIPQKKFLLVGESWGGALVKGLVIHKKKEILGICLLCTISLSNNKDISAPERTILQKNNDFLNTLSKIERETFCSVAVIQTKRIWNIFKKDVYPRLINYNEEYLKNTLNASYIDERNKSEMTFDRPILLISGKQDHIAGYEDQANMFMKYPRTTLAVLDEAGHCLQIEQEKLFQTLVADWLDRVKRYTDQ